MSIMHFSRTEEFIWGKGIIPKLALGTLWDYVIVTAGQNPLVQLGYNEFEQITEFHRWRTPNPQQQNVIGDWLTDSTNWDVTDFQLYWQTVSGNTLTSGAQDTWRDFPTTPGLGVYWTLERTTNGTSTSVGIIRFRPKGSNYLPQQTIGHTVTLQVTREP